MELKSVAVSARLTGAPHYLDLADEAFASGRPGRRELPVINRIISAAEIGTSRRSIPATGFLAENAISPKFVEVAISSHRPTHEAMESSETRFPPRKSLVRPRCRWSGSDGLVTSESEALGIANKIGYPILIKGTAGGGGQRMRVGDERRFAQAA